MLLSEIPSGTGSKFGSLLFNVILKTVGAW